MTVAWHWRQASNPHARHAIGIWVDRLYFSQQITHSVLGGLEMAVQAVEAEEVLVFTGAGAIIVLASIIDVFVDVSVICVSDLSSGFVSIFRICKLRALAIAENIIRVVCVICDM